MANKHPYTKTIKKAIPTTRISDKIVKKWDIEVICASTENGWTTTYKKNEDVEYLGKTAEEFTKSELIDLAKVNDHIFDAHWEAHNTAPTTERDGNFDFTSLAD